MDLLRHVRRKSTPAEEVKEAEADQDAKFEHWQEVMDEAAIVAREVSDYAAAEQYRVDAAVRQLESVKRRWKRK